MKKTRLNSGFTILILLVLASCKNGDMQNRIDELQAKVDEYEAEKKLESKNIALFDEMDFVAFSDHDMDHINRLHAEDVYVMSPDGSTTETLKPHSDGMAYLFKLFPDMIIDEHPVKFASGDWTAGLGISRMTFTEPYHLPDGSVIQPNGKKYQRGMITLAKWKEGKIVEEYIFYDNQFFIDELKGDSKVTK